MKQEKYRFQIKLDALEKLKNYAHHDGDELCGVLTGSQIGVNTFRISKVSEPFVVKSSRYNCECDALKANLFIQQDYELSGETRFYIGEWHTHSEPNPNPSQTDYDSFARNFEASELCERILIMVIVGTETLCFRVYDGQTFTVIGPMVINV